MPQELAPQTLQNALPIGLGGHGQITGPLGLAALGGYPTIGGVPISGKFQVSWNMNGIPTQTGTSGSFTAGWNASGGGGEIGLLNDYWAASATIIITQRTGSGTQNQVLRLNPDGTLLLGTAAAQVATQTYVTGLGYAPLAAPALTGIPTAPTAAVSTNTTQIATTAFVLANALTSTNPVVTGTLSINGAAGTSRVNQIQTATALRWSWGGTTAAETGANAGTDWALSRYSDAGGFLSTPISISRATGAVTFVTPAVNTNTTQAATTAFVLGQVSTAAPLVNGVATVGTSFLYAREGHIHPTDTSRAALASPTFTGIPAAPTATALTNTTQIATTAQVFSAANPAAQAAAYGLLVGATAAVNTAAIVAALAASKLVVLPPGTFSVTGGSISVGSGQTLRGAGAGVTVLMCTTVSGAVVTLTNASTAAQVTDLTLDRNVTADTTGHGVNTSASQALPVLARITSQHNYYGFLLANTDFAKCIDLTAQNNLSHGFYAKAQAGTSAMQWYFTGANLAQQNGLDGFRIENLLGPASCPIGTLMGIYTYANVGRGLIVVGTTGHAIFDLRLNGFFIGEDGAEGIYLDTFGTFHQIENGMVELEPNSAGISISANNQYVRVSNVTTQQNGRHGIYSQGAYTSINNCVNLSNGHLATDNNFKVGVALLGDHSAVVGGVCSNTGGDTQQRAGVQINANYCSVVGVDCTGNSIAPLDLVSGSTTLLVSGVQPSDGVVQFLGRAQFKGIGSGELNAGAADSGGAGYRLLRVPN